jgi:arylsulfatase A-like enzyme
MKKNPAGTRFNSFSAFLETRPADRPFCFWFGSTDPHRGYKRGSGEASGMDLDAIRLPACFPDHPVVRGDVADYYWEVQRFDREVGGLLDTLERRGELDDTLVVMTGDHNMPFPRCKANLYDSGSHVGLAVRWPGGIKAGRVVEDFVGLPDLAPTFLELAGLSPPEAMTYRSLAPILTSGKSGRIDPRRDHILIGKERHCPCQEAPDSGGTPMRAIRTHDYLYIRNFRPDRWPAGTPNFEKAFLPGTWYGDCDNGPTKTYMIDNRDTEDHHHRLFALAFEKRPAEELYFLPKDPGQLNNVADDPAFRQAREKLSARLMEALRLTGDPRVVGGGDVFDRYPYTGGAPKHPSWSGRKKP